MLSNSTQITEYFRGKVRFEVKLENKRKIMRDLDIVDTSFQSVMSANPNAVLTQFNKVLHVPIIICIPITPTPFTTSRIMQY